MASVGGGDRVGVRIAPAGTWNHMYDSNPGALFTYVAQQLHRFDLAYLHIVEPRVKGNTTIKPEEGPIAASNVEKFSSRWL
jgi:N-ethylmaleimide reductase